jgi:molecular chaperone GrpE
MIDDVRDAAPGGADGDAAPDEGAEPEVSATVEAFASGSAAGEALPAAAAVDFKDRWLRSEAELQNFRRRAARDREEAVGRAEEGILLELIGVLDDLERALASLAPEQAAEPWVQGVSLTARRMLEVLARWDVTPIEAVGRPFDPTVHEALLEVDPPEGTKPGTVVQVALTGYRRGDRALRAARVVVAKART